MSRANSSGPGTHRSRRKVFSKAILLLWLAYQIASGILNDPIEAIIVALVLIDELYDCLLLLVEMFKELRIPK